MSRSFQVHTEKNPDFTTEDIISTMKTLKNVNRKIDFSKIKIVNHSGYDTLVIKNNSVHITFYDNEWTGKFWDIDSRALRGMGKNLFVACACAVGILSDGYVVTGDGAWVADYHFSGHELWDDYISPTPVMTVSTNNGDKICQRKSEIKRIILNSTDNDIWISENKYPCLVVLVSGKYACIHWFEDENGKMFQSAEGIGKEVTFIAGGTEWTAPPESVVTIETALKCVDEFCDTLNRPECIEWEEL
ncbi:MAG: Imm1 family immunity protein [Ruminococcus flavefaciens]|nr:Imm1 family immunity protein [Ruminococcus flavefaciens]